MNTHPRNRFIASGQLACARVDEVFLRRPLDCPRATAPELWAATLMSMSHVVVLASPDTVVPECHPTLAEMTAWVQGVVDGTCERSTVGAGDQRFREHARLFVLASAHDAEQLKGVWNDGFGESISICRCSDQELYSRATAFVFGSWRLRGSAVVERGRIIDPYDLTKPRPRSPWTEVRG